MYTDQLLAMARAVPAIGRLCGYPADLVDEAFMRRIPYRIEVCNPDENEFHNLFQLAAEAIGCSYNPEAVEHLLEKYYRSSGRPLRRCHPRDILQQIKLYCIYHDLPFEMRAQYIDCIAQSFFTNVKTKQQKMNAR